MGVAHKFSLIKWRKSAPKELQDDICKKRGSMEPIDPPRSATGIYIAVWYFISSVHFSENNGDTPSRHSWCCRLNG